MEKIVTRLLAPFRTLHQKRRKMKSKAVVAILSAFLLMTIVQSTKCDLDILSNPTRTIQASTQQRFRCLAVEANFSNARMYSGQYFIRSLMNFSNWNNETQQYVSYIELLSLYGPTEIFDDCKRFYKDRTTKSNVHNEITNFLGAAQPGETTIFYCCTDGGSRTLMLDAEITASELTSWLKSDVICILDACFSGSWINDGVSPGNPLGTGRVVLCSSKSNQSSWSFGYPVFWSWFTGQEKAIGWSKNGPLLPLGVIGGFFGATDANDDGWISASEDFLFAQSTTEQYALLRNLTQTPVSFNGLGRDIPLVRLILPVASFTYSPSTPIVNQTITFNASASYSVNGNITAYRWDFGDGNITTVTNPIITHRYASANNYSVTLNVTDSRNVSASTTVNIIVPEANRDIALTSLNPYRSVVGNNTLTSINVTVANEGDVNETFNVTLYCNNTVIENRVVNLNSSKTVTLKFSWNTTGMSLGNYTLTATAGVIPEETDTGDNTLTYSLVRVSIAGDVNADGRVDIIDVTIAAVAYSSTPGDLKWNSNTDVNEDGVIDILDIAAIAVQFGRTA